LGLLGYQLEYQPRGVELNGKNYHISYRAINRARAPIHIIGYRDPAGLDRKPEKAALRMSAHALVQEYLNLHDEIYGIVTNGRVLRLLRDTSRLVKLTYLEFDLDRIFTDGLFADFAMLFRLLHASRLPATQETEAESVIERYHQDSLDSGARIRAGLSRAVEQAIRDFANGFLAHPDNQGLRDEIAARRLTPDAYYQHLLRLIYRILFLLVIEERDLVYPPKADQTKREIYDLYYSLQRLRRLSEKRHLADRRRHDLWLALLATFQLFEADGPGQKLGIAPLAGDLFHTNAIGPLANCTLGNDALLGCLRALGLYENPETRQLIRVNYAALNVEEFGSVYEGLLEFEPVFIRHDHNIEFDFAQGDERAATGSHYTPDDLVQPLLKHSLDYLIAEKLKEPNPERALLSLRVADVACGSGHILLSAARRIATELAIVRTGEDQPSPVAFRTAVRDVIRECIYGVDLNPLAVELCKVALWLEAHNPGEPLNFLDHHIKCGNAIVGYVRPEDVERGVPDEAFATMPGDDKETVSKFRKRNKAERKPGKLDFSPHAQKQFDTILRRWRELSALPERTPAEIEAKKQRYIQFTESAEAELLIHIAAIPIAQFYLPKTAENPTCLITDEDFRDYWTGRRHTHGQATAAAHAMAWQKRFFHWFLEFPEIIERGGFDCILGNPPYLGGQGLSGTYGHPFCHYVKWEYAPSGLSDLVVYFVRRIYGLLRPGGFTAFITTNSIKDGDNRRDGLENVLKQGGAINFAMRSMKWPGRANLAVSLIAIHKGEWRGGRVLDGKEVSFISAYFEDSRDFGEPMELPENTARIYQGVIFLGDGFLLTHDQADRLIKADPRNRDVVFRTINGDEINNRPTQDPQRSVISFHAWSEERSRQYSEPFSIVEQKVKPERMKQKDKGGQEYWWRFLRPRNELQAAIDLIERCFVSARVTKHLNFSAAPTNLIFTNNLYVLCTDRWDIYAVVQSTLHEVWARKYSMRLEERLQYSPSDCFVTFPFPEGQWQTPIPKLADIGERYHEHRRALMLRLWLGLTDLYNLYHARDLTPELVAKVSKKPVEEAEAGYQSILELRRLHRELDNAVRDAYGWRSFDLEHNFYEVETLPENDRVRYTISPAARKGILSRLLALNHQRHAEEEDKGMRAKKKRGKKANTDNDGQDALF
ncbi:MAG: restriction endonuclease, partial [Acidobacteria bacterium]|nr:restriction endonuclease [Acidobacteriota bacterium]